MVNILNRLLSLSLLTATAIFFFMAVEEVWKRYSLWGTVDLIFVFVMIMNMSLVILSLIFLIWAWSKPSTTN